MKKGYQKMDLLWCCFVLRELCLIAAFMCLGMVAFGYLILYYCSYEF